MTDYEELVKRLYDSDTVSCEWGDFCKAAEAADAIKALIRENEELDFLKWEGGEESIGREIERTKAEARNAALEEAAKVCDRVAERMRMFPSDGKLDASDAAAIIRALKEKQP